MTFIDLFKNYWVVNRNNQMPLMCASVYFYLLNECNIRRWINPFNVPTRKIELELGMPRKSFNEARNLLKQRGLIDFQNGKGKAPASYTIIGVNISKKGGVVTSGNNLGNDLGNDKSNNKVTTKPTQTENTPINIFKDINKTKKDINKTKKDIKTTTPIVPLDGDIGGSVVEVEDHKKFFVRLRETPTGGESIALQREGISEEDVEVYGREVIDDWIAEGVTHNDERERLRHFMRRLKIKRNIAKQQQEKSKYNGNSNYRDDYYRRKWNDYNNRRGVDADAKKEKDWNARF